MPPRNDSIRPSRGEQILRMVTVLLLVSLVFLWTWSTVRTNYTENLGYGATVVSLGSGFSTLLLAVVLPAVLALKLLEKKGGGR